MPSYTEKIDWKIDAMTTGITLANTASNDLVSVDRAGFTQDVQIVRPARAASAKPRRLRNHLGRRTFTVTSAPAASAVVARTNLETLEASLRGFSSDRAPILEWIFGAKLHTFSDAALESCELRLIGSTLIATYTFVFSSVATTDVTP